MNETENELIPTCMSCVVLLVIILAAVGYGNVVVAILGITLILMMAVMILFFLYRFIEHCFDIFEDCSESELSDSEEDIFSVRVSEEIDVEDLSEPENVIVVSKDQIKLIENI